VAGSAGDMLDLIEEGAFVATGGGRLQPVSKTAVFSEFMAPLDLEEEIAARDAEVALAFLVEQGMVEVAGDEITVPARFWSGGQPPAP
jgi:predicted deacylase